MLLIGHWRAMLLVMFLPWMLCFCTSPRVQCLAVGIDPGPAMVFHEHSEGSCTARFVETFVEIPAMDSTRKRSSPTSVGARAHQRPPLPASGVQLQHEGSGSSQLNGPMRTTRRRHQPPIDQKGHLLLLLRYSIGDVTSLPPTPPCPPSAAPRPHSLVRPVPRPRHHAGPPPGLVLADDGIASPPPPPLRPRAGPRRGLPPLPAPRRCPGAAPPRRPRRERRRRAGVRAAHAGLPRRGGRVPATRRQDPHRGAADFRRWERWERVDRRRASRPQHQAHLQGGQR
ncbi:hypothetical protein BS78_01G211200 [Paspalum vaginatum]|nr:hypothetical protein BS78_01G211200 [Paspalum vaginatum]